MEQMAESLMMGVFNVLNVPGLFRSRLKEQQAINLLFIFQSHSDEQYTMSLPDDPFFQRLAQFANGPPRIIINDDVSGIRANYRELL